MVEAIGRCMICRGRCFNHVWLCQSCYDQFPELQGKYTTWPEWARFLKNQHKVERFQENAVLENEIEMPVDLADLLEAIDDGQDDDE